MLEITKIDHDGRGIGYINNKIVFVENTLPGELVDIKIIKEKKNYIEAEVKNFIKKSNIRTKSPCPFFPECGGCNLFNISYDNQLIFKQNKIENIVNKYLNQKIKINKIVKCDNELYYRNKTTFQIKETIGFYKNKSYNIIPVNKCLISNKLINNSINYLKRLELKYIKKIICRASNNQLMIIIETDNKNLDISPLKEIASSIYLKVKNNYIHVYKEKYIKEKIGNYNYLISPDSFFQVNINTCFKLYLKIKEYVGTEKNVLDLYCGTGSISIFVSESNNILGIEINEDAIKDAKNNAKINDIKNINFICGESGKKIANINFKPDVIIVDPPRNGLNKETITNIFNLNSKLLIYVSCDPMTLIRDLNILIKNYNIIELTPFDMFPNTKHIECLVLLSLKQNN